MLFDKDGVTGMETRIHKGSDKIIVQRTQDTQPLLDLNKQERANESGNFKGDLHKVASIPLIVVEQWVTELKQAGRDPRPFCKENRKWLIAKLNSPEFSALRTKSGNV